MKNIVDKLMKLWTEKEKNWSKKSSTTVIFPCKIFSVFTVPRHEILPKKVTENIKYKTLDILRCFFFEHKKQLKMLKILQHTPPTDWRFCVRHRTLASVQFKHWRHPTPKNPVGGGDNLGVCPI